MLNFNSVFYYLVLLGAAERVDVATLEEVATSIYIECSTKEPFLLPHTEDCAAAAAAIYALETGGSFHPSPRYRGFGCGLMQVLPIAGVTPVCDALQQQPVGVHWGVRIFRQKMRIGKTLKAGFKHYNGSSKSEWYSKAAFKLFSGVKSGKYVGFPW